ncbi:hypothetical protein I4U23_016744 [Adineta vaga]|nr:hypothetical protein I4U23_016744 [Adineta vaga]
MTITTILFSIHAVIFYDIYYKFCQIAPNNIIYKFFFSAYLAIVVIFIPHVLMLIFTINTVLAIRKSRQRIKPAVIEGHTQNDRLRQRLELKLIKTIILQVILSVLLSLLRLGSYSYNIILNAVSTIADNNRVIVSFAVTIGGSLYFFSFATPFYVSILTNREIISIK